MIIFKPKHQGIRITFRWCGKKNFFSPGYTSNFFFLLEKNTRYRIATLLTQKTSPGWAFNSKKNGNPILPLGK